SVPSGTDQSTRASPPVEVSPETPALTTSTLAPRVASARCSLAGKASAAPSPSPAVSESPSTTILSGWGAGSAHPCNAGKIKAQAATKSVTARRFTRDPFVPYERDGRTGPGAGQKDLDLGRRWTDRMNDTSLAPAPDGSAIALCDVNLSLGRGAAR